MVDSFVTSVKVFFNFDAKIVRKTSNEVTGISTTGAPPPPPPPPPPVPLQMTTMGM
jgi:hypothetical protein